MNMRMLCAAAIAAATAAMGTGTAGAIVPANGGDSPQIVCLFAKQLTAALR